MRLKGYHSTYIQCKITCELVEQGLTVTPSVRFVSMAMTLHFCSQTICQKSLTVLSRGPTIEASVFTTADISTYFTRQVKASSANVIIPLTMGYISYVHSYFFEARRVCTSHGIPWLIPTCIQHWGRCIEGHRNELGQLDLSHHKGIRYLYNNTRNKITKGSGKQPPKQVQVSYWSCIIPLITTIAGPANLTSWACYISIAHLTWERRSAGLCSTSNSY